MVFSALLIDFIENFFNLGDLAFLQVQPAGQLFNNNRPLGLGVLTNRFHLLFHIKTRSQGTGKNAQNKYENDACN